MCQSLFLSFCKSSDLSKYRHNQEFDTRNILFYKIVFTQTDVKVFTSTKGDDKMDIAIVTGASSGLGKVFFEKIVFWNFIEYS